MSDERMRELLGRVRETYHAPPETPRGEMWEAIEAGIRDIRSGAAETAEGAEVIDLSAERERRSLVRPLGWAAAAAVLAIGIGIGRGTAPVPVVVPPAPVASAAPDRSRQALDFASREYLGRSESLLTMVRAEARGGGLDPMTAEWARQLLSETRLLMDVRSGNDREVAGLLEDLELVLAQIVGAAELGSGEDGRASTELSLAMKGLEEGDVLPRIQAALPRAMAGA